MPVAGTKYILTREQIVAVFSGWTANDVALMRSGRVDAQAQAQRFLDDANALFETADPPGIPTLDEPPAE